MNETTAVSNARIKGAGERLRIVVLGYIVRCPMGGMAWSDMHYLAGLAALGHDVWFVEDSCDYASCFDPVADAMGTDPGYGLAYAARALRTIGFDQRWAYHDAHASQWFGPCAASMFDI